MSAAALLLPLLFKESARSLYVINEVSEVGSVLTNVYDFLFCGTQENILRMLTLLFLMHINDDSVCQ